MKKIIFLILVFILLISSVFWLKNKKITPQITENQTIFKKTEEKEQKNTKILKIGEQVLNIEVADTDAKRVQGLSGKEKLGDDEGMLFVFEKEGNYSIWMKDMKFPIDIAWLDKNKKIIHIENSVSPGTYPKIFNPFSASLYVLEVNAGLFEKSKIKIGDSLNF